MANGVARNLAKEVGGKTRENLKLPVESLYFDPKFEKREELGDIDWIVNNILEGGFWNHEPILARPDKTSKKFEVVNGRRRFRACLKAKELGWKGMVEVAVTDPNMTNQDLIFMTINSNNDSRKPFSMGEEGEYFQMLVDMETAPEDISKKIGKSITYVLDRLALANVDSEMKDEFKSYIQEGKLSPTAAAKIAKISDKEERDRIWGEMKSSHNAQVKEATKNETPQETVVNGKKVTVVTSPNGKEKVVHPVVKKMKVSDVAKKAGKGTEHISIKILKKNLEKCETMFKETGSDYWECGVKVLMATLANKEFEA